MFTLATTRIIYVNVKNRPENGNVKNNDDGSARQTSVF